MQFTFDRSTRRISHLEAPVYVQGENGLRLFLDGQLYYHRPKSGASVGFGKNAAAELPRLIEATSLEDLADRVEGDYALAVQDPLRGRISFLTDKIGRRDIFYYADPRRVLVADSLQPFLDAELKLEYDADALLSSLAMCIPRGLTIFRAVKRLRYNEILHLALATGELKVQAVAEDALTIADYGDKDLARYKDIVEAAILSRASDDINIVQSSGGYDSTLMLAILRQEFGRQKVRSTVFRVTMPDGCVVNPYEIDKVVEIGKRLDVDTHVIDVDYRDPALIRLFADSLPQHRAHQLFTVTTNQFQLASVIKAEYGPDVTVFNGEGCDSLHNFGFSQFISIPHTNMSFAEYADNMKTWLFGPDFFRKVLDGSFAVDDVYRTFRSTCGNLDFVNTDGLSREELLTEFLVSFVMSDVRLPFRRLEPAFLRADYEERYRQALDERYFTDVARRLTPDNLYYHYSVLYADFHLQGPEIRRLSASLTGMRVPYLDSDLFRYLARMPQSFGRGLELRRNKYPLKELIRDGRYRFPLDVIERTPHSYLREVEQGVLNTDHEYLVKSRLADHLRDLIDLDRIGNVYSADAFDLDELRRFLSAYKRGDVRTLGSGHARAIMQAVILCRAM
jgi:hypothetical protein